MLTGSALLRQPPGIADADIKLTLQGENLDQQLRYWEQQLDQATILELPTDRPRPAMQSLRGAVHIFVINKSDGFPQSNK